MSARKAWLAAALLAACASTPETHFYRLAAPTLVLARQPIAGVLYVESLEADAIFSDERIVYRTSPYKLDYYNYHRWTSPPAVHLTDYLRDAYARSGLFSRVVTTSTPPPDAVLSGRVTGFEEVDESTTSWRGRLELELTLSDARSDAILWNQRFSESERIPERTPEGLAVALSTAMGRIVQSSAAALAQAMKAKPSSGTDGGPNAADTP
jgi:uncharacterized lipoprotein YmbA